MTTQELEELAARVRDAMFPKNGKPWAELKAYDRRRYIRGTAKLVDLFASLKQEP
jgi:hypothetical protein